MIKGHGSLKGFDLQWGKAKAGGSGTDKGEGAMMEASTRMALDRAFRPSSQAPHC